MSSVPAVDRPADMETVSTLHEFGFCRQSSDRERARAIVAGQRECGRGGPGDQHPGAGAGTRTRDGQWTGASRGA